MSQALSALPNYVHQLPTDSIMEIVSIVRQGEVLERKQELAKHYWVTESYVWYVTVGEPGSSVAMAVEADPSQLSGMTQSERFKKLEELANTQSGTEAALSPLTIALLQWLLQFALDKLQKQFG